jgi:anti-sigma factor RsiW
MKCDQSKRQMQEYVDGLLSPVVAVELEDHAARCDACRAELALLLQLCRSISSLPEVGPDFDPVAEVRERIADLPRESFAWPVVPKRELGRVWAAAALLWVGMVAAAVLSFWSGVSALGSKAAGGLSGVVESAWGFLSGAAADLASFLAPIGRAGYSASKDLLMQSAGTHILLCIAGFLLACLIVVAADRAKRLKVAGTVQRFG